MIVKRTFWFFASLFALLFNAKAQPVYDTVNRKQTVYFDVGAGGIILYGHGNYNGDYFTDLHSYQSSVSFQTTAGYGLKLNFIQFDWKLGYTFSQYTIDVEQWSHMKGPSAWPRHTGSSTQHTGFVQLLGVSFGKERSWGSLFIGPYVRYNFWTDSQNSGKTVVSGLYWDGSITTPVYEESAFEPPLYYGKFTVGFQFGSSFTLDNGGELLTRIELNGNANDLEDYKAIHGFICLGYTIPLKKDRVTMRRK